MPKQDFDRPVAPTQIQNRGNGIKYVLVAVVSVLATLGLVATGLWFSQLFGSREAIAPSNTQVNNGNTTTGNSSTQTPAATVGIQPGQFVQNALGNKAQVELTTVRRIPGAPDEVSVEMRINRLTDDAMGSDIISVGSTTARNPITSETYQAVDLLSRSSGSVSLYQMRRGQPVEGYVVLKVPAGVNAIDIFIPETGAFKNVAIAEANQVPSAANNSPVPSSTIESPLAPAPQVPQTTAQAPQAPSGGIKVQPSQFIQPAFGTKGQVELLSVKRVQDPDTRTRTVVNVQMRIRRFDPDIAYGSDVIYVGGTTARNPETSETYEQAGFDRSTGSVSLSSMRTGASADAYVWLRVPEGVNTIDIYVPDTQAFKNVRISN
jgi:hypothetical protein